MLRQTLLCCCRLLYLSRMLSIITTIHNQLPMNRLFLSYLRRYTHYPFELVVVDNGSTDNSARFFEENGAILIRNQKNLAYPTAQNQGAKAATKDYLVFMNNDVLVGPQWDKKLLHCLAQGNIDIISPASIDRAESRQATAQWRRKWKQIRYCTAALGFGEKAMKFRQRLLYGSWERFCEKRWQDHENQLLEGFAGHTLLMHRATFEKVGPWDERILQADFDLYLRARQRWELIGDVRPIALATGVFVHHYGRLTMRSHPDSWVPTEPIIEIEDKWGAQAFLEKTAHLDLYRAFDP